MAAHEMKSAIGGINIHLDPTKEEMSEPENSDETIRDRQREVS